tara:strand:- start:3 stop:677 length:675 start_codon:yes stop_codon:yes gene_type:complete
MISWLKGQIIRKWYLSSKKGIVIACAGVGYEVQILSNQIYKMDISKEQEIWIHQIQREDCTNLYGFNEINQRDLFRKLISVNGIGAQIGMSLLEDLEVKELILAIEESNIDLLCKSQGIGKRIAERLVVDLKNKLQQFKDTEVIYSENKNKCITDQLDLYIEEIKSILNSLGYLDNEIKNSLELIKTSQKDNVLKINTLSETSKKTLMEKHLKEILLRLSEKST